MSEIDNKKDSGSDVSCEEAEECIQRLLAIIPGIVYRCLYDSNRTMEFIGDEITGLTGFAASGFINNRERSFSSIINPNDQARIADAIKRGIAAGEVFEIEYRLLTSGNREIWVKDRGMGVSDSDGEVEFIEGLIIDISEQKNAEEALDAQRKILTDILDDTLSGYWDWNIQEESGYLSPSLKRMLGYDVNEVPNNYKTWQDLIYEEDLPLIRDSLEKHFESGGQIPFHNEVRYLHKSGYKVWVICTGRVVKWDEKGLPLRMVGCHIEISNRKIIEEQLTFQNSFQCLVSSIASSFVRAGKDDLKERLQGALDKTSELFEVDRSYLFFYKEEPSSFVMNNSWISPGVESEADRFQSISAEKTPSLIEEFKKKPYIFVSFREQHAKAETGEKGNLGMGTKSLLHYPLQVEENLLGLISFSHIKIYKEWSEEELLQLDVIAKLFAEVVNRSTMQEKMIVAEQQATAMAMVVTANHEINQPLTIIQGYTELLHGYPSISSKEKYLKEIRKAIERIKKILESMNQIQQVEFTDYVGRRNMVKLPDDGSVEVDNL
jgi:PAS domain S-box-containing protein